MTKTFIAILILAASCFGQNSINNPSNVSIPTGTTNVLPTVVSTGAVNVIGAGSSFTGGVAAPASIVNGNCLVLVAAVAGANSETFTPPAGFSQIGSTVTSTAAGKVQMAVWSKVAASESGTYALSFNNGTTTAVAAITQLSGTSCAADNTTGTVAANAATITLASTTTTQANDLLFVVGSHIAGNPTVRMTTPGFFTSSWSNNGTFVATAPNGSGSTPSITLVSYVTATFAASAADDFVGMVIAFAPNITSATTPFTPNSASAASSSGGINVAGSVQSSGVVQAGTFVVANGGSATASANSYAGQMASGAIVPMVSMNNSNNIFIDGGDKMTAVTIGTGIRSAKSFRLGADTIDQVSFDASQDIPIEKSDSSNNVFFGCVTSACTGGTQENDVIINAQTSKVLRFRNNAVDVATVTGSGLSATAYLSATNCSSSAAPAVCGSAAAGSFTIVAAGTSVTVNTTAVTANSQIFVQEDESLGTKLGVTCNTGILANPPAITARTAATSFAVGITAGLAVNPVCFSYWIVN